MSMSAFKTQAATEPVRRRLRRCQDAKLGFVAGFGPNCPAPRHRAHQCRLGKHVERGWQCGSAGMLAAAVKPSVSDRRASPW